MHNHGYDLRMLYDNLNLTGRVTRIGMDPLGRGGCSNVFEGILDGQSVAVKVIREVGASSSAITLKKRLVREVRAWADLHHRNVLPLLGFTYFFDPSSKLASLVSPWMRHGTATQYLEGRENAERIRVLTNVADGLCYLHRHNVVHGDLKGANILIDERLEPRLADFGLSKLLTETNIVTETATHTASILGSVRWMAKELFDLAEEFGTTTVTYESDVWAFGMTVLEFFTSQAPYHHLRSDPQVIIAIHRGDLPIKPDSRSSIDDDVWDLCLDCWRQNPALRPSTKSLAKKLWELDLKCKLNSRQNKRRSRDSPGRENSGDDRLRKSPKLGTLAELAESTSSPGTPRSLVDTRNLYRPSTPGSLSRSSSLMSSSSGDQYNASSSIDPRRLFSSTHSRSEWSAHPERHGSGSRLNTRRTQTEPVMPQYLDHSFEAVGSALGLDVGSPTDAFSEAMRNTFHRDDSSALVPSNPYLYQTNSHDNQMHHPHYARGPDGHVVYDPSFGTGSHDMVASTSLLPYGAAHPSQWTSFPEHYAPTSQSYADGYSNASTLLTPRTNSYDLGSTFTPMANHSPSPSPFMPQTPIFSEVFGRSLVDEPLSFDGPTSSNFASGSQPAYPNTANFTTMAPGILSPAMSDAGTPIDPFIFTDEPCHVPTDTPVIGSYDSFDEIPEGLALFGGVDLDDDVLERQFAFNPETLNRRPSRRGTGSTEIASTPSSCSQQSSRQSSGGVVDRHPRLPPTPQLSPLLSSF